MVVASHLLDYVLLTVLPSGIGGDAHQFVGWNVLCGFFAHGIEILSCARHNEAAVGPI